MKIDIEFQLKKAEKAVMSSCLPSTHKWQGSHQTSFIITLPSYALKTHSSFPQPFYIICVSSSIVWFPSPFTMCYISHLTKISWSNFPFWLLLHFCKDLCIKIPQKSCLCSLGPIPLLYFPPNSLQPKFVPRTSTKTGFSILPWPPYQNLMIKSQFSSFNHYLFQTSCAFSSLGYSGTTQSWLSYYVTGGSSLVSINCYSLPDLLIFKNTRAHAFSIYIHAPGFLI